MSYSAPGKMTELNPQLLAKWNVFLSKIFEREIKTAKEEAQPPASRAWIYDPIATGVGNATEANISWTAFPKRISDQSPVPGQAWARADNNRNNQEEYCEWEVARDTGPDNKILRVTLTCETADYYTFLAKEAPDLLLSLYRKHVSPQVELSDLISNNQYVPQNKWNYPQLSGMHGVVMHMAQINNSFRAAVNLSAIATWPRVDSNGVPITGEQELIACSPFGDSARHSDPHIGAQINALVRAGNEISFADPVGLYMDSFDTSDWETPDGSPAENLIRIVRGSREFALRVVFEAPAGAGFSLGDVLIGGRKIRFGGQIVEKVRVRIRGIARPAASPALKLTCGSKVASLHAGNLIQAGELLTSHLHGRLSPTISIISPE
jgi:hypothetical protein